MRNERCNFQIPLFGKSVKKCSYFLNILLHDVLSSRFRKKATKQSESDDRVSNITRVTRFEAQAAFENEKEVKKINFHISEFRFFFSELRKNENNACSLFLSSYITRIDRNLIVQSAFNLVTRHFSFFNLDTACLPNVFQFNFS